MSHTQNSRSVSVAGNPGLSEIGEIADFPLLSDRERETAFDLVESRRIRSSIEPLIGLFLQLGLRTRGFRGCVQVPYGKPVGKGKCLYKRTIPVWVVDAQGPTNREVRKFLGTDQFVDWLVDTNKLRIQAHRNSIGQLASGFQTQLTLAGALPAQGRAATVRSQARAVPPPSAIGRAAPPPSTAGGPVGAPPSYVSQLGDVRPQFSEELSLLESEFRSTPRVNGGAAFDESEYFRRLDALNGARERQGLAPVEGVTPSTYVR